MTEQPECTATVEPYDGLGGQNRYLAYCTTCGVVCTGWTEQQARAAFDEHRTIPAPPAAVAARPLTPEIVADYVEYYIIGRGRPQARTTKCAHGYYLTVVCPCCP